jgi:putative membrane-bound dehydrogenase-like protein
MNPPPPVYLLCVAAILTVSSVATAQQPAAPPPQTAPFPLSESARRMTVPEGFNVSLFAGEPDVAQPIAFCFDDRGRLWVAECYAYPDWQKEDTEPKDRRDRIVIFEDTDGDGKFDKRTVFADHLINLSGIEIGMGGVWVCSTPNLMFFPNADGDDDKPDGPPTVLLNGFSYQVKHNVFNGLTWGPDGWLYGLHGILATSAVGPPNLPPDDPQRTKLTCSVWKIHPVTKEFEVVCQGTTNPFGLDFDEYGQGFFTNCVISHLWHVIPGAHYKRMYGEDFNPYTYSLMDSCADHLHWAGGSWTESRGGVGKHGEAGGGHAHVGAMVYLGDNWPDRYRNTLFTCNLHGLRVNNDTLERSGSGYVARHGKDFLFAHDQFFRGLAMKYGPDGGVYLTDWSDTGECHDYDDVKRDTGRIYKITYGKPKPWRGDVSKLKDEELVQLQLHKNEWFVRRARLQMQYRNELNKLRWDAHDLLEKIVDENPDVTRRLRALWALGVLNEGHGSFTLHTEKWTKDREELVRAWAVDHVGPREMVDLARTDRSPVVRLRLASRMQRLDLASRWPIAEALAAQPENANDANLPLMIWYGIEPAIMEDRERALSLLMKAKIPLVREYIARRLATTPKRPPAEAGATPAAEPAKSSKPAEPTLADPAKTKKGK